MNAMKRKKQKLFHRTVVLLCLCLSCVAIIESFFGIILIRNEDFREGKNVGRRRIISKRARERLMQDMPSKDSRRRKIYPKQANSTYYQTMQNPYGGAFVHTGKTGGSTLSVLLRNGCHSFMPRPCRYNITHESVASKLVESYYHVPDFGSLRQSNHTFYIVTCRDPLDRTISAFVYDHIRNRYTRNETISPVKELKFEDAYKCFPTLQQFVELLGDRPEQFHYPHKQNWVSAESCPDLAKAAFHSRVKIYNHLFFSMRLLLSFIPNIESQTFFAIRQEHLWNDWTAVNKILGQVEPVFLPTEATNRIRNVASMEGTNQMPVTRELNAVGIALLCNALRAEYRAYFFLLRRAMNLSPNDVQRSIDRAKHKCPNLDLDSILESE